MAFRGTLTHRKTRRLAASLTISNSHALGLLEAIWHLTAEQAYQGNIGRLSNADIAMELYWEGNPDILVEALVSAGWLDPDEKERLLIHDWDKHADYNLRRKLVKNNLDFLTRNGPVKPVLGRNNGDLPPSSGDDASQRVKTRHESTPETRNQKPETRNQNTPPDPPPQAAVPWGEDDDDPDLVARKLVEELHQQHPVLCSRDVAITACIREMEKYAEQKPRKLADEWRKRHAEHKAVWVAERANNPRSYIPHLHCWFRDGMYLQDTRAAPPEKEFGYYDFPEA